MCDQDEGGEKEEEGRKEKDEGGCRGEKMSKIHFLIDEAAGVT